MESSSEIITLPGLSGVKETMDQIVKTLSIHGITLYARINQQTEANRSGLTLKPTELLIFGNPKGGIPLLTANPLCGLDLPLKVLAWEDDHQKVWLSYYSFDHLQNRFNLPVDLIKNISGVEAIIRNALFR